MILEYIFEKIKHSNPYQSLENTVRQNKACVIQGLPGSSFALIQSLMFDSLNRVFVCVFNDEQDAIQYRDDQSALTGEQNIWYYPAIGAQLWKELGPQMSITGHRLAALKTLVSEQPCVVVTTPDALLEKVYNPIWVKEQFIYLKLHRVYPFLSFVKKLINIGFVREERVDRPGEMSVRGGLVDVYLFEETHPHRIEFFGDEIESIRQFDVETQRSLHECSELHIIPPFAAGHFAPLEEMPLLNYTPDASLLDYCNPYVFISNSELCRNRTAELYSIREDQIREHHENEQYQNFYWLPDELEHQIQQKPVCKVEPYSVINSDIRFPFYENDRYGGNLALFKKKISSIQSKNYPPATVLCESDTQLKRLQDLFEQEDFPVMSFKVLNVSRGFHWPDAGVYIITNREIYSRIRFPKPDKLDKRRISLDQQLQINPGDYVVHEEHGIGLFRGLTMIKAYGRERECLIIEYKDNDKLYVPLEKMDQVQKYSSREGVIPALNKLGTMQWEKLKKRTKKKIKQVAEQLIKLYATRKTREGYQFSEDTVWQKELEASFQYEETFDQITAVDEIKSDMQKNQPMDRLICGDVGYGKTEVAIRAAFKAISDDKQVCILVPTTILAQQHFETFVERMQKFPVSIELLSRFKSAKQQRQIIENLEKGKIDLIIGTHRLLSRDIKFRDLGLLVVDEEQKFGVMHKEKLKLLKETVDTLTLSATPIPRTMHMSLIGAKDLSVINTPPHNRLPVKTEVSRFDRELIREAILKEVDRGGQVFFVHNRVQSIHAMAAKLFDIVPEVSFAVAHGQMKGHELERVMHKFVRGEVQVLVSTMIIESGIDMPKANTLIVNRADKLGLSQLYQLRGRVGRSKQQAYAYLLIPKSKRLTRDAIKRLQTIQEYSHLGAGYKIAMRDLEIRGAGNIFGAEQTGFVNALGFELFTQIIRQSINEVRKEMNIDSYSEHQDQQDPFDPRIKISIDAYLPSDYIRSDSERVDLYKRLVQTKSIDEIDQIQRELVDRFGPLPDPAQNLLDYIYLKRYAVRAGVEKLSIQNEKIKGEFNYPCLPKGEQFQKWLGTMVQHVPDSFELNQEQNKLKFTMRCDFGVCHLKTAKKFLQSIA